MNDQEVQKLMDELREWGDATFGDKQNPSGIAAHLVREAKELHDAILRSDSGNDWMELADCFILLLEVASHLGVDVFTLVCLARRKFEVNKRRKWGEPEADGSVQHIQ